tara:strand:- start:541 stop:780 length:240 start_codon:yes stop_codon:yes gene_type:complete
LQKESKKGKYKMDRWKTIGAVWTNESENLNGVLELYNLNNLLKDNPDKIVIYLNKNKFKKREDQPEYNIRVRLSTGEEE